jgi:hypothetical protein
MPISLFPFTGGINGHIDTRLLPDGALADARNVELTRQGRLVVRPGYTAQARTTYSGGTFTAFDVFSLHGRLFALGYPAPGTIFGDVPDDVYELMPSGLARAWRATSTSVALSPRLPRATRVRDLARPPDQVGGLSNMGCAAGGGYVCLVWNSSVAATTGYVFISRAADDQPVIFEQLSTSSNAPCAKLRAVALSDRFLVVGLNSAGTQVSVSRLTLASDISVQGVATSILSAASISTFAVCKVAGTDEFCVVANLAGTVTVRRFNAAGTLQVPSSGQYNSVVAAATVLAVEASSSANQINVAMVVGGEARIFSHNLATGANIGAGPFVPFAGETSVEVTLARVSSTVVQVLSSVTSETAPTVFSNLYTVATNTFTGARKVVTDAQITTSAVVSNGLTFFGVRVGLGAVGGSPNLLVAVPTSTAAAHDSVPQIAKDLEVAGTTSALLPDLCVDASTGKAYWTNAAGNADGDLSPLVTEFELDSTERRQVAIHGNLAYIAGGMPCVFDGTSLVESGFATRPRIISLTPSNGAGELLSNATYRYRAHWEWVDSPGNLHLSPPSAITNVDMGASDDTIAAVVTSPHSLRNNRTIVNGSARCVLSRTLATVSETPAIVTGSQAADPPSSALNGLHLTGQVFINGTPSNFSVAFSALDTSSATIAATITAAIGTVVQATAVGGSIVLTTVEQGEGVYLYVFEAEAGVILGFSTDVIGTGTTEYTVGENFQRAATAYTTPGAAVAAYVTVTDTTKDQSEPIVDTDLIRQQVLYSSGVASGAHHAPPPGDAIWAGRERVGIARQPKRSRWTESKLVVPAEPAEFAYEGFVAFSGQVAGDVEAGYALGDATALFTRGQIWIVTGSGPNRSGQGEFFAAQCVSESIGIAEDGWRSLARDDEGLWFQGSDGQIYRLAASGSIEWLGREAQDKLELFPVVTAAAYIGTKREVAFALQSDDGTDGGILRYQPESKAWFFDDVGAVAAMCDYGGRIAYVQAGVVYVQDAAPGLATFVDYDVTTGMFQGFQALGYGQLNQVGVLLTYRGPCTLTIYASEDGEDFSTAIAAWSLTGSEYSAGDRVRLLAQPALMARDSFALKVAVTHAGSGSEGVWLHAAALDTEQAPRFVRLGPTHSL